MGGVAGCVKKRVPVVNFLAIRIVLVVALVIIRLVVAVALVSIVATVVLLAVPLQCKGERWVAKCIVRVCVDLAVALVFLGLLGLFGGRGLLHHRLLREKETHDDGTDVSMSVHGYLAVLALVRAAIALVIATVVLLGVVALVVVLLVVPVAVVVVLYKKRGREVGGSD